MGARYPFYLLADSREGQLKEAEIGSKAPSTQPTHGNVRHGFVYERVPHITLKSIANNAEIDVIWEKWQATLEPLRTKLNTATKKQWQEWEIPREADKAWPEATKKLHSDWWTARIARQKEIDASIAAKAEFEFLYDRPYEDKKTVRVAGPFTVESLSPHRMLGVDENDELIDSVRETGPDYPAKRSFPQIILDNLKVAGVQQAHKEDRITFTSLVPTHYIMVLALPESVKKRYDVASVGKLMISSAPARRDTKLGILEYFTNGKLYELYGSTEHGWVTLLRPEEQLAKLGSVGREWAGSGAIRLLDEEGREVPDGEVGELFSRTAYVFDGYWNNPEKTAEAFRGDWCSVGDMARRDEDGYIWLVDRKSNMIISGGENIYPSEVEGAIGGHPRVKDVAVIGVPHEKWGESVHAVVVLHEGESATVDEIRAWSRERLAAFKCPTAVTFMADADMPRTGTGKILHRVLRKMLVEDAPPASTR